MNSNINNIIQHLFDRETLQDVPRGELVDFATRYPYASMGRYLLAQKTYDEDPDIMHEGVQTTSLYINNPLWLQWLLSDHKTISEADVKTADTRDVSLHNEQVINDPDPGSATTEDHIVQTEENRQNGFEAGSNHHSFHQENEEPITDDQQQIAREQYVSTEWAPGIHTESIPAPENGLEQQDTTGQSSPEQMDQTIETEAGFVQETDETPPPEPESSIEDEVTADERPIAFQSYHTIDYFASQGIRLQQAELAKDKLGQQLKSFTEWLRSMKKLPPPSAERMSGDEEDSQQQNVVIIAGHSIEEKEVVTEAMAEVWAKQGRLEKARAVYHKLSLQNPHKSAYFAAKIDQLKV